MQKRKVVLLGSTGSIGKSTLKVAADIPDRLEIVALAANSSVELLAKQARETGVKHVALYDCLLYTSPSPRDKRQSRMPSSA